MAQGNHEISCVDFTEFHIDAAGFVYNTALDLYVDTAITSSLDIDPVPALRTSE